MATLAPCDGGMRTSDLNAWVWPHIDLDVFATCTVPRSKTAAPEVLEIPEVLRPFLLRWWEEAGKPTTGPVFPARRGRKRGSAGGLRGTSYADRLRRDASQGWRYRLSPVEVPARGQGYARSTLGRTVGTMPAPARRPALLDDRDVSALSTFNSFRRVFNTALCGCGRQRPTGDEAGEALRVSHMRYVGR